MILNDPECPIQLKCALQNSWGLLQRGEGATNRSGTAKIGDFRIKQRHFSDILRYVWPFIIIMKALNGFLRYKYK